MRGNTHSRADEGFGLSVEQIRDVHHNANYRGQQCSLIPAPRLASEIPLAGLSLMTLQLPNSRDAPVRVIVTVHHPIGHPGLKERGSREYCVGKI